jgi:hypothetical protein
MLCTIIKNVFPFQTIFNCPASVVCSLTAGIGCKNILYEKGGNLQDIIIITLKRYKKNRQNSYTEKST